MQGYAAARNDAFTESRECFRALEDWLASEEAAGLQHADLEEQLDVRDGSSAVAVPGPAGRVGCPRGAAS